MTLDFNEEKVKKHVQDGLYEKGLVLQGIIEQRAPMFTGDYRDSWETIKNSDGTVKVRTLQGDKGRKLEFGGGSGEWPNVGELREWVSAKIGPENLGDVTYLVGRSIKNNGVRPQPHIRPGIREFQRRE